MTSPTARGRSGGSFCPQLAPGEPETCGDCLAQGPSPASVVGVRPQFQACGIISRSSCPVTGGAVGICSLSLSPHPLFIWNDSADASLGHTPRGRLPCSHISAAAALNHESQGCCLELAAFGSALLPGSWRLDHSWCSEHRTRSVLPSSVSPAGGDSAGSRVPSESSYLSNTGSGHAFWVL